MFIIVRRYGCENLTSPGPHIYLKPVNQSRFSQLKKPAKNKQIWNSCCCCCCIFVLLVMCVSCIQAEPTGAGSAAQSLKFLTGTTGTFFGTIGLTLGDSKSCPPSYPCKNGDKCGYRRIRRRCNYRDCILN